MKTIILLLMPILGQGRIIIDIRAGNSPNESSVSLFGYAVDLISEEERKTFHLTDNLLKEASGIYSGKAPTDVFVKSPTPWNDLYKAYGWPEVTRVLKPTKAIIEKNERKSVEILKKELVNELRNDQTLKIVVEKEVKDNVSNSWSSTKDLTLSQEISYTLGIVNGSTVISYLNDWGKSSMVSKTKILGTTNGFEVEVKSNEGVATTLFADKGIMEIRVEYEAYLKGGAAVNYKKKYNGHHFYLYDINEVLEAVQLPKSFTYSELIRFEYYSDTKIVVEDLKTNQTLTTIHVFQS